MLKAIGSIQLALATLFVVPNVTGQDTDANSLESQLEATLTSLEYLTGLRDAALGGDPAAVRAIEKATEPARDVRPVRDTRIQVLRDDIARLRFSLDRILSDPAEVSAVTAMPPSVLRSLGLAGAPGTAYEDVAESDLVGPSMPGGTQSVTPITSAPGITLPVGDGQIGDPMAGGPVAGGTMSTGTMTGEVSYQPGTDASVGVNDRWNTPLPATAGRPDDIVGTQPTTGINDSMRAAIRGELPPLDSTSATSRRRANEAVPLEGDGFIADRVRLGSLLVRADRPAEAIEVLSRDASGPAARYWLARAYESLERLEEAIQLYRPLAESTDTSEDALTYGRYARQNLAFLEFKRDLERQRTRSSRR